MEIVAYNNSYHEGVIECLRRNYEWMLNSSFEKVSKWAERLFLYSWINSDVNESEFPYKHGMVLIDNNKVVGYIGLFYSYRTNNGTKYSSVNLTTWAIDDKYRGNVFKIFSDIHKTADVIFDLTPRESMKQMCLRIFKYELYNNKCYMFVPVPCFRNKVSFDLITDSKQINDSVIKSEFDDLKSYGVKLMRFGYDGNECFVFYHVDKEKTRSITLPWVEVLGVSNPTFFAQYLHSIVWKIQAKEKALLKTDECFIGSSFKHPLYKTIEIERMILNKNKLDIKKDLLYSEFCVLEQNITNV